MAQVKHSYNVYGNKESSMIILAKPGKKLYCVLNGIDSSSVQLTLRTNNTAELTFTVDKYIQGELTNGYDYLDELMELYCSGIWFKISTPPTEDNDGIRTTKQITAESYEIMLTQYMLNLFKINMGEEGSYEYEYMQEHDPEKFYQVKFYDPIEPKLSLLHLILSHADVPGWKIGYVDNETPDDEGILLPDEICNFDVDEKNVYAFLTQDVAAAYKCVFEFDTINLLINVYRVESLGKDTNIVLGFRNIQDRVSISRENSMVTQYYVDGLSGYNIDGVNFMDSVITDLSYYTREPYMNPSLVKKYNAWIEYRESQREPFIELTRKYNDKLDILSELKSRVPVDTASNDWFRMSVEKLKTAYDDNMAIIKGLESLYLDEEGNLDLEALKASPDWPLYESIMNYTLPAIVAALQQEGETVEGFGKGNIICNVNPVTLGSDWFTIGADISTVTPYNLDNAPAYGITRGIDIKFNSSGSAGILQKSITVEESRQYVLSCFVKGSGTIQLEWGPPNESRNSKSFTISSGWTRVYADFFTTSKLVEVAFIGNANFSICGMQLEMGLTPSQFGYFTQSENILFAYETDWKLYGIDELETKLKVYQDCVDELKKNGFANPYNPLSQYKEDYHTQMHQKYLDYQKLIEECTAALEERKSEYEPVKAECDEMQKQREEIAENVLIETFGKIQDVYEGFTDDEIFVIKSLCTQGVYTNENIIVTTLTDPGSAVDKQLKLYNAAVEDLYVESHPQFDYTDDINNIYALPEFKDFHDDLQVNNFIRLGLDDSTYIKLRLIEIIFNPLDLDETMTVTFSNMIQYKSKRNDFNSLIDESLNKASRNGGRVSSVTSNDTTDYVITSDIIKKIFSNPLFDSILGGSSVGGAGSGGTGGSGGTITAEEIIAELVKADEGIFEKLTADTAFIKYLSSQLITSEKVVTSILEADEAIIKELSAKIINVSEINADIANIKNLLAGNAGVGNLTTINLTAKNVKIDEAVIKEIVTNRISVADLLAHSATTQLITLISSDGKPTIAFQNSTQQFYDSSGNVRVQIGQDGNGDFNFVVRGEDGTTAIFDSQGIKKEGIPDNTIINDMIEDATISKDKIGFPMVEPNDQGGVDITQIYDGNGEKWGIQYESFKTETNNKIEDLKNKAKNIILCADQQIFINDQGVISPSIIKVYALLKGDIKISHWYIDDVEQTEYIAPDKSFINIPNSYLGPDKQSISIKATDDTGEVYDVFSLYYIESGTDAVTVTILSSNGNIFKASEGIETTELSCVVFRGSEEITPNSYKWLKQNKNMWEQVGTESNITVNINQMDNIENYKCQVDI